MSEDMLCDLPPKNTRHWKYKSMGDMTITDGSLVIAINRHTKNTGKFAIFFEHFDLIRDFDSYENEEDIIAKAKAWCAAKGDSNPKVVYPGIISMKVS